MKKKLLFTASLLLGASSFGQFTQLNEPSIGEGTTLYVIDSSAVNFEAVIGSGVEWDYSSYGGYGGYARNITVLDPSSTTFSTDYPTATAALDIQGFLVNYTSSTATERMSQGFVYSEVNLGDVVVKFSTDEAMQYTYPFALGDNVSDNFEGEMYNAALGTQPLTGTVNATFDGFGTLKLADGVNLTDVSRYRISDISTIAVSGTGLFDGTYELERDQFEYYDLTNANLPVFVYTTVILRLAGSPNPLSEFNLALSSVDPLTIVNVEELNTDHFSVFPNPSSDIININLSSEMVNASFSLVDASGRIVMTQTLSNQMNVIDMATLEKGIYVIQVTNNGVISTNKLVIN